MSADFGSGLPDLRTPIPGPRSRELARRLALVESRNITKLEPESPIFWEAARGANVRDADGNIYIDLTAGFGVATAGHAPSEVIDAIARQARELAHGLGDVYPSESKVLLLEKLAQIAPGDLAVAILASAGAEAVEAALKTAVMRTGRTGIIAFENSYHGLTYGALSATHRADFRAPFEAQLFSDVHFVPFPTQASDLDGVLRSIDQVLAFDSIGAILVEPIQGRGGIRLPAPGFLTALRDRCDGANTVLIFDEIYTGMGRTGRWFACEHYDVVPDLLVIGKGLTGSLPLSAALGSARLMQAWPPSHGEAMHTSTFLGNPVACAAAIAQIALIEQNDLIGRAMQLGDRIAQRTTGWKARFPVITTARGLGALQGVAFTSAVPPIAVRIMEMALQRGVIVLPEGPAAEVLALTPPVSITDTQLDTALDILEACLLDISAGA